MGIIHEFCLNEAIENCKGKKNIGKEPSLKEIVRFIGWDPTSPNGILLSYAVEKEIIIMREIWRKNKENYAIHSIMSAKGVSEIAAEKYRINDITLAIAALNHDDVEEDSEFKIEDKRYRKEERQIKKDYSVMQKTLRKCNEIKKRCLQENHLFLENLGDAVIYGSDIDIESVIEIEGEMTKKPDEFYYKYLERIFGRDREKMPEEISLLNILRMAIIKTKGDRAHNTTTIPRADYSLEGDVRKQKDKFTIAQRLKECCKSIMTINRAVNLLVDYPELNERYEEYVNFLMDSKYDLIKAAGKIVDEDKVYLISLIGSQIASQIENISKEYYDYKIRKAAGYSEIIKDPKRIFDGTLARYDGWIRSYKRGIPEAQNIGLTNANKKWMQEYLRIEDPQIRVFVQEYMDCLMFLEVLQRFKENPKYTLRGFKEINK